MNASSPGTLSPSLPPPTVSIEVVCVGGGHSHVHVLREFGRAKDYLIQQRVRVTLIAETILTPYSGMLPGYIAGNYTFDEIHIDLHQLCQYASIRLIHAAACRITYEDGGGGLVYLASPNDHHPPIRYDVLSINVGSTPQSCPKSAVPVKPIAQFCLHLTHLEMKILHNTSNPNREENDLFHICIVGGGAGGVEVALALHHRFTASSCRVSLVTQSTSILETHNSNRFAQRIVQTILQDRGIQVYFNVSVETVESVKDSKKKRLVVAVQSKDEDKDASTAIAALSPSSDLLFDEVVWCTSAGAAPWFSEATPFATTRGFLTVNDTFQCIQHPGVFAAGDCCHFHNNKKNHDNNSSLPKAGVFAVRAGPILFRNLLSYLQGQCLTSYRPQRTFLSLVSTGNKYAVASKGSLFAAHGAWCWVVKDWIDRHFIRLYQYPFDEPSSWLARQWRRWRRKATRLLLPVTLSRRPRKHQLPTWDKTILNAVHRHAIDLAAACNLPSPPELTGRCDTVSIRSLLPSDAATTSTSVLVHSTCCCLPPSSWCIDPYLWGQICATHALGPLLALDCCPLVDLTAQVIVGAGNNRLDNGEDAIHFLSGVNRVLQLHGGHHNCTSSCILSVQATGLDSRRLLPSRGGRVGDKIVLVKPLGTSVVLNSSGIAGIGKHLQRAIETMTQSNLSASHLLFASSQVRACSFIGDLGLVGCLKAMLDDYAQHAGARLKLKSIPFLPGAVEASSLAEYSHWMQLYADSVEMYTDVFPSEYALLFTPELSGGLICFVDTNYCDEMLLLLQAERVRAAVIGELVHRRDEQSCRIRVLR